MKGWMVRYFIFFLGACAFSFGHNLFGQQKQIDSLNTVIRTLKNDTAVANAYNALSNLLAGSNPDTIISISEKVFSIVDKKLPAATGTERRTLLLIKADAFTNVGYVYQLHSDFDKALEFFQKGYDLQLEVKANEKTGITLNNIAVVYYRQGKTKEALDAYEKSLKVREEMNDKLGVAQSLSNMGAIYYSLGQTEKALDLFHRSLKMREGTRDRSGIAVSFNNIASIYQNIGQIENALKYFERSYSIYKEIYNKEGMANALHNIGGVYDKMSKLPEALDHYQQSLKIYEALGNKLGLVNSYVTIGGIYARSGKVEDALATFNKSLQISENIGDKRGISFSHNNIGTIQLKQKNIKEAKEHAEASLKYAKEGSNAEAIRNANLLLTKADSAQGNYAAALEHYKQYITFRDSLVNENTRKTGLKKQMQYEFEKKEENARLEQEKKDAIHNEELRKQKQINWLAGGAMAMVLLSSLLLFNRYRLKQKNTYQEQLNIQQKEQANAVLEVQEQERKRIAEDLHDSLGHLLSTAKLNLQTLPGGEKKVENSLQLLNQASEEIRNITFNLMPRTLEEGGLIPALQELALKVTNSGLVNVLLHVHDMEKFNLEKQSQFNIYRIVQEAVNNILKHAAATEINIQLIGQNDHITIMIEDDGKGFDTANQKSGRGLKNIVTRSLWLKGNINIDSSPGRGTTITTEIPV